MLVFWDFFGFMIFSTIEGISVFALALYLFRFNFRQFIWPSVVVIELVNILNFLIREESALSDLAPVINILITILFLITVVRVPLLWSMVMTVTSYAMFTLIQTLIIVGSFGSLSPSSLQSDPFKGYLVQVLTGVIGTLIGWILYKRGIGFAYEFEKIRLKWEQALVLILIGGFILGFGSMMYYRNVSLIPIVIAIALVFLYYSLKKEAKA